MPKITVILPTYNCENYITECIDSLLSQTFSDFELLAIDDKSTDNTVSILESYEDARIRLHIKEKNSGYTDSLNWGIAHAQGQYIARMDGDDICHPERFQRQVTFLDERPEIALVGTKAQVIDGSFIFDYPSIVAEMKVLLLLGNNLVHPSVMGRVEVFKEYPYDRSREPAEDYDLWTRIARKHMLTNIPEILFYYRVHDNQISTIKKEKQDSSARKSMLRMFKLLAYDYKKYDDSFVRNAIWPHQQIDLQTLRKGVKWFKSLKDPENKFDGTLLGSALSRKRYNLIKYYAQNPDMIVDEKSVMALFMKEFPKRAAIFYYHKLRS